MINNTGEDNGIDRCLLLVVLILSAVGIVMVYSSTALLSISRADESLRGGAGHQFTYLKKHIMTLLISFFVMWLLYGLKTSRLKGYAYPLLLISMLLLLSVFIPGFGVEINGAKRWVKLWPSTFQPSELAKFSMVLYLSYYLSVTEHMRNAFKVFIKPVMVMVILQGIIIIQPDFGGVLTLGLITVAMLFIAGTPFRYILLFTAAAIPISIKLMMEPYRLKRVTAFLDPWKEAQGSGFQLVQSFIALGSGGISGVGLGESKQKLSFLPEVNTDFIFSLIGEELGFIGASAVMALFLLLFIRGIKVSNSSGGTFPRYLSFGLTLMITLQAIINMFVVTGMAPTKGLPLPFISYGGSSLLINLMAVGILLRISKGEDEESGITTRDELIMKRARAKARRLRRNMV